MTEQQPTTEAGRRLADDLREWEEQEYGRDPVRGLGEGYVDDILAIEAEVLDLVLKGLRSEDDTVQLRAVIAQVEAMRIGRSAVGSAVEPGPTGPKP